MSLASPETLVFVGLSGVSQTDLNARLRNRQLPAIARVARAGAVLALAADGPLDDVVAWTGIATGRSATEHGVLLPDEPWAGGVRPVTRASWRQPPVWERLQAAGVSTASVNWPASAPGATWSGSHVDDRIGRASAKSWDDWPLPPDLGPPALREKLRELRVHPADVDWGLLAGLVQDLEGAARYDPYRLELLAALVARAATVHAAAMLLARSEVTPHGSAPRVLFVHHGFLSELRDAFEHVPAPFDRVVEGGWALVDAMIDELARARPEAEIMIASPGRPGARGALVLPTRRAVTASTLDLAPTVLSRFGLGDPSLPGRPLLPTKDLKALSPAPPPAPPVEPSPGDIARVRAFGLEPPASSATWPTRRRVVLAQLLLTSDPAAAGRLLDDVLETAPSDPLALVLRVAAHVALEEAEALPTLADRLAEASPGSAWAALGAAAPAAMAGDAAAAAPHLMAAEALGGPDERMRVAAGWLMVDRPADARRLYAALLVERPDDPLLLLGMAAASNGRPVDQEVALRRLLFVSPRHPEGTRALVALLRASGRRAEADMLEKEP